MDLSKYAEKQQEKIGTVKKKVMMKLYSSIISKTPVDTGRARGNWNISIGKDDESVKENQTLPQYESEADFPNVENDDSIFITNNLPYICKLEYGGFTSKTETEKTINGFSKQAPNGMVGITVNKFQKIVDESVK